MHIWCHKHVSMCKYTHVLWSLSTDVWPTEALVTVTSHAVCSTSSYILRTIQWMLDTQHSSTCKCCRWHSNKGSYMPALEIAPPIPVGYPTACTVNINIITANQIFCWHLYSRWFLSEFTVLLKPCSERPTRLNSTQLAVELSCKSVQSESGALNTLTTQLNSTRLNWNCSVFRVLNIFRTGWVELSWVELSRALWTCRLKLIKTGCDPVCSYWQ